MMVSKAGSYLIFANAWAQFDGMSPESFKKLFMIAGACRTALCSSRYFGAAYARCESSSEINLLNSSVNLLGYFFNFFQIRWDAYGLQRKTKILHFIYADPIHTQGAVSRCLATRFIHGAGTDVGLDNNV